MATEDRIQPTGDGRAAAPGRIPTAAEPEPPLGELFRQLAEDSATLIRQEMQLARTELRESVRSITRGALMLAIGGGLLLVGLLALTAFLIVALGAALDNYWLGALIVALLYGAIGGVMLMRGKEKLQGSDLKPEQTIRSLQEDKRWAQSEAQQVKRDLTS
jgi:uncharacterized membrane protein YqjE